MQPTWATSDGAQRLLTGDCRVVLPLLDAESFTACVTDPPYELKFMGRRWDASGVAFDPRTWAAVLRVLKPGAHLLAFGGTRTYHRMACAIEDAGFEIRDCIMWVYGSGFPKSLDVSKAIDKAAGVEREVVGVNTNGSGAHQIKLDNHSKGDTGIGYMDGSGKVFNVTAPATDAARLWSGYGTALKPAVEPIIVARKPLVGTVAENCQRYGCGVLNVDGCRVGTDDVSSSAIRRPGTQRFEGQNHRPHHDGDSVPTVHGSTCGRWPANLIHDGSEEVLQHFPHTESGTNCVRSKEGYWGAGDARHDGLGAAGDVQTTYGDAGSAARFFYCAKASRSERGEGNKHPTVKPLALMEYLVKLVTMPTGNRILDPFAGSGTTLLACYNAFVEAVGIDLEADHVDIGSGRIANEVGKTPLFSEVAP